jgi:hypothetical protein
MAKKAYIFPFIPGLFHFWYNCVGLTTIGVGPDHVIKGANQRTLGEGSG